MGTQIHPLSARAVEQTSNRKVGAVSVTMASQQSCPNDCPLYHSGCYAESGPQGIHTARLNRANVRATALQIAKHEAREIDGLSGTRPLRLHVVGDCKDDRTASTVSAAADRYTARANQPTWGYTHGWRNTARASWGKVSILASCETTGQAHEAIARGYAAAIVVQEYRSEKTYQHDGLNVIPCPEMTGRTEDCTSCRLCWNDRYLRESKSVVAFRVHGSGTRKATQQLINIQGGK